MEILAFRGDESRGTEIKNILESLGGYNAAGLSFTEERYIYYFKECDFYRRNIIKFDAISDVNVDDFEIFTVDEFKEKFKFKVGDLVHLGEIPDEIYTVTGIRWDYEYGEVVYEIDGVHGDWYRYCLLTLVEKKRMTHEVPKSTRLFDNLEVVEVRDNEVEIVLDGCDSVSLKEGMIRIVRNLKYPKNYEECCKVLCCDPAIGFDGLNDDEENLYRNFIILKRCRDAYWKIAGEEMGLYKPWEPDWESLDEKYNIYNYRSVISHDYFTVIDRCILSFPIQEMRDDFYENFKDLIEECKELL